MQLLQVVRGGPVPRAALPPHAGGPAAPGPGRADARTTRPQQLAQAYRFLRQVEHRIQYLDDQQTHVLPTER